MQTLQLGTAAATPFSTPVAARAGYEQAGIVHDLGNLIQVVTSALNILARELTGAPKLIPIIATARSSLDRASRLVRQNIAGASEKAEIETIDLERCLVDLLPALQSIGGSAVTVALATTSNVPPLQCNPLDLENAVLNLAVNARDAMPMGGTLAITLDQVAAGTILRVADNGHGMSPEVRARALEPFFTTKGELGGSGVGLAMVARFAAAAEGRVEIESAPGVGTTITLLFRAKDSTVRS